MKVCTAVQKTRVKSSRKSVNKRYFLKLINLYLGRIFLDDPFLAITLIRHENSPDNKQMNAKITPKTAQFSVWPKSLATMRSNPSCHATTQVAKTRLNDLSKGKHEFVIRGVFIISILWVLSVKKIFIQHPQFFSKVLKYPKVAGANSLFFKIAGAKALIASVLITPLLLRFSIESGHQEILFRAYEIGSFMLGQDSHRPYVKRSKKY